MTDTKLIASLFWLNQNQLALGAAVEELWGEQRGSVEVAENIRAALWPLDNNLEFISMGLAVLNSLE
ncbi:hypothetical protein KV580_22065 [Pseudomonas chlororaphis]|nr:hypothetical protein [Pseudomonas chlororaphis]